MNFRLLMDCDIMAWTIVPYEMVSRCVARRNYQSAKARYRHAKLSRVDRRYAGNGPQRLSVPISKTSVFKTADGRLR